MNIANGLYSVAYPEICNEIDWVPARKGSGDVTIGIAFLKSIMCFDVCYCLVLTFIGRRCYDRNSLPNSYFI